jgi:hypothetical protein
MQERRRQQRQKTYLGGQVAFRQRYCAIDCLVRNLSQDGARLVLSEGEWVLPTEFDLLIPHRGDSRAARIVWRNRGDVGVQFLDYLEDRSSVEATRRINTLKKQNTALTRRVADLSEPAY